MSDKEILQIIQNHADEAVTATEVADETTLSRAGVLERLNDLAARGVVTKKTVGSRAVVWWVSDSYVSDIASLPGPESQ